MNIRIKIPDKMINNQPYTIREYKIFRLHKDSATNQATVDENGKVTAVGNGTATITATSVSGSYTVTVSVTGKIPNVVNLPST